jgi:flagellar assembly factor FliW
MTVTAARLTAGAEGAEVTTTESDGPTVLRFADGIPGFADAHGFVLSDLTDEGTFQLLTSVDHPDLSLVVTSPWLFFPDYAPELSDGDQRVLGIERPEDVVLFCTVTADDTDALHLNLRAPFVANARTHAARQVVLDDDELPLRATVTTGG